MSNLLPEQEKRAVIRLYRKRFISLVLIVLAGLFVTSSALLLPAYFLARDTRDVYKEKRNGLTGRETSSLKTALVDAVTDVNKKLSVFEDTRPISPATVRLIDPVISARTQGVRIEGISFTITDPKKNPKMAEVRIQGVSSSREALISFSEKVKTIGGLSEVSVPVSNFIQGVNVSFTISAKLSL